jgi:hypothetical protein
MISTRSLENVKVRTIYPRPPTTRMYSLLTEVAAISASSSKSTDRSVNGVSTSSESDPEEYNPEYDAQVLLGSFGRIPLLCDIEFMPLMVVFTVVFPSSKSLYTFVILLLEADMLSFMYLVCVSIQPSFPLPFPSLHGKRPISQSFTPC